MMRKNKVVIITALGAGAAALCIPDIRAYRRLAAITRSTRETQAEQITHQHAAVATSPAGWAT